MSTQPSWDKAKLKRDNHVLELKVTALENDLDNVRKSAEPYDAGGDAVCGNCDMTLGSYEDFVSSYRFCPYCGCQLTWGAYWTGEYLC